MDTDRTTEAYLTKAEASLAGAESEFANRRIDNCASRAYYACFQAAIAALLRAGIRPGGRDGQWDHDFVESQFVGQLINRRHHYPTDLRGVLVQNRDLRHAADYGPETVSRTEVRRALRHSQELVLAIRRGGGSKP